MTLPEEDLEWWELDGWIKKENGQLWRVLKIDISKDATNE